MLGPEGFESANVDALLYLVGLSNGNVAVRVNTNDGEGPPVGWFEFVARTNLIPHKDLFTNLPVMGSSTLVGFQKSQIDLLLPILL